MRYSHLARFGVLVVSLVFAAHEAMAQAPGAMNPRMGGNRGGVGAGVGGGVAGSSVPMMGPQRASRRSAPQSFNGGSSASSQISGAFNRNAMTNQVMGASGAAMRSAGSIIGQTKTVNGAGPMGMGGVRAR